MLNDAQFTSEMVKKRQFVSSCQIRKLNNHHKRQYVVRDVKLQLLYPKSYTFARLVYILAKITQKTIKNKNNKKNE